LQLLSRLLPVFLCSFHFGKFKMRFVIWVVINDDVSEYPNASKKKGKMDLLIGAFSAQYVFSSIDQESHKIYGINKHLFRNNGIRKCNGLGIANEIVPVFELSPSDEMAGQ
jgi:hypothetical protein